MPILNKFLPFLIVYFFASRKYVRDFLIRFSFFPLSFISLILLAYFLFLAGWYSVSYLYLDHVEPNIADVSYSFLKGQPPYHSADDPVRYAFPYGPMLYILNGFFLRLLGPSIFSSKIGGVIAGSLSLCFMFMLFKRILGSRGALIFLGYLTWLYLNFANITFWNRSDSYLLFFLALSLLISEGNNRMVVGVGLGIILGIMVNLKIHSFLYLVPIYFSFYWGHNLKGIAVSLVVATITAMIPFFVYSNISIPNYITCLLIVSKHPLSGFSVLESLKFIFFYLLIPLSSVFFIFQKAKRNIELVKRHGKYIILLAVITFVLIYLAAREGAGVYHMIPLVLIYMRLFSLFVKEMRTEEEVKYGIVDRNITAAAMGVVFAFSFIAAWIVAPIYYSKVMTFSSFKKDDKLTSKVYDDISKILAKYPRQTIQMGYGGQYAYTYFRPLLTFHGQPPLLVDAAALMHWMRTGYPFPEKAAASLEECQTRVFLIPKGGEPFKIKNYFDPGQELFSEAFKKTFYQNYRLKETSAFYDVWVCASE